MRKTGSDGKLLPEMILVCQALRNVLRGPNEWLRCAALRLLARVHEEGLLEPLVPSVLECLDHRKAVVRRAAVLAVDAVASLPADASRGRRGGAALVPDAPLVLRAFLDGEDDPAARRAGLAALSRTDPAAARSLVADAAREAAEGRGEGLLAWPEGLQLAALAVVAGGGWGGRGHGAGADGSDDRAERMQARGGGGVRAREGNPCFPVTGCRPR